MTGQGAVVPATLDHGVESASGPRWIVGPGPGARAIAALIPALQAAPTGAGTSSSDSPCVCIVPALADRRACLDWTSEHLVTAVADPLVWTVREIQSVVSTLIDAGKPGRIVIVLPSDEAMGVAGDAAGGAVCGGILSMARTLSLELNRKAIAVNVVCVDPRSCSEKPDVAEALRGQLQLLLREDTWITGQEIWVTGGTEAGRMRP